MNKKTYATIFISGLFIGISIAGATFSYLLSKEQTVRTNQIVSADKKSVGGVKDNHATTPTPVATTHDHSQHANHKPAVTECKFPAGTCELIAINDQMHKDMSVEWTGDITQDFINTMIPHHQGAVDMANTYLKNGADPVIKKLSEEIVALQNVEIDLMRKTLEAINAREGGKPIANIPSPALVEDVKSTGHHHH